MKRKILLCVASMTLMFTGCAQSVIQTNPNPDEAIDSLSLVKMSEYERGYKTAIKENKEKWIDEGFKQAENSMMLFKADMKAYKAGMYAVQDKFLTNARIYGVRKADGSVTLKVISPEILVEKDANEILSFYRKYKSYIEIVNEAESRKDSSLYGKQQSKGGDLNSIGVISYTDTNNNADATVKKVDEIKKVFRTFPKSYKMTNMVEMYGLNCNIANDTYICEFQTEDTLKEFCTQSGQCSETAKESKKDAK